MEKIEIISKVTEIFRDIFKDINIVLHDDMTANDIDNWDSLTNTIMITEIEKSFSIKFKMRELIKLKNVGLLIELIEKRLN